MFGQWTYPAVKSLLPSDEQVLVCYEIIDKPGGGEKLFNFLASSNTPDYYAAYVITPKRLICVIQRNKYSKLQMARQLTDIFTIREVSDKGSWGFVVEGFEEMYFWFTSKTAYDRFLALVGQGIDQAQRKSIPIKVELSKSPEERLRVLVQLHKDGLVDDAEFELKRKEILGQL